MNNDAQAYPCMGSQESVAAGDPLAVMLNEAKSSEDRFIQGFAWASHICYTASGHPWILNPDCSMRRSAWGSQCGIFSASKTFCHSPS